MARVTSATLERATGAERVVGRSVLRKEDRPLLTGSARVRRRRRTAPGWSTPRSCAARTRTRASPRIDAAAARALPAWSRVITAGDLPAGGPAIPMRMFPRPGHGALPAAPARARRRALLGRAGRGRGRRLALPGRGRRRADRGRPTSRSTPIARRPPPRPTAPAPVLHPRRGHQHRRASSRSSIGDVDGGIRARPTMVVAATIRCAAPRRRADGDARPRGRARRRHRRADGVGRGEGRRTSTGASSPACSAGREERIRLIELARRRRLRRARRVLPRGLPDPVRARSRLGRPVGWTEDREEHLRATNHSREQTHEIAIALRRRRHVPGAARRAVERHRRVRAHARHGRPGHDRRGCFPGPTAGGAYRCAVSHVVTNKTPAGTYRAPGRYEANARPRAAHRPRRAPAAAATRVDLRRQQPRRRRRHALHDGHAHRRAPGRLRQRRLPALLGPRPRALRLRAHARAGAPRTPGPRPRPRDRRRASSSRRAASASWECARVGLSTSTGRAVVARGAASRRAGRARPCSRRSAPTRLGVALRRRHASSHGDTAHVPDGMGSFGSRATALAGSAVRRAATDAAPADPRGGRRARSRRRRATSRSRATASSCAARPDAAVSLARARPGGARRRTRSAAAPSPG